MSPSRRISQVVMLAQPRHLATPGLATRRSPGGDQEFQKWGGERWREVLHFSGHLALQTDVIHDFILILSASAALAKAFFDPSLMPSLGVVLVKTRADTLRKDDFDKFSTGMIVSSSSTAASSTTTTSDYTSAWKHAGYTKVPLVFLRIQIHLGDKGEAGGTDSSHNCASTSLQTTPPELAALSTPKPRAVHTLLNLGIHSIKHAEMYNTPSGDHVLPRQGQMEG
ncbi:hypothetical protein BDZ97DRAFT_2071426 [Flammula alnicola]|nr:hypothetical protein BDZ97DRAFT_2071426 [Flammula alnicola]